MSLEKFCYMKRIVQFSVLVCFFIGFNLSCSTSEQDGAELEQGGGAQHRKQSAQWAVA